MKRGNCTIIALSLAFMLLCACGNDGTDEQPMTVSQELASSDVSENIVPLEALEYSRLSYPVPEGFVAASDNTDVQAIYVSETQGDPSYICYTRQPNDGSVDYMTMTTADMEETLSLGMQTEVTVEQCTQEEKDGWQQVDLVLSYEQDGNHRRTWQNIYITEKYVFIMAYVQAGDASWEAAFTESAAQTVPQSIAEQTSQENN